MARGMPVVSTDWSSTAELVHSGTGWPVPCRVIEVGAGWSPYPPDAHWADPNLDAAARALREIADDPGEARRRGAAAREHIAATRSLAASAAWVTRELMAAHETWRSRASAEGDTGPGPRGTRVGLRKWVSLPPGPVRRR